MKRKIVSIDEALCNGCGQCIPKCAEGALQIVNGKARIVRDTYCAGLGACLGHCPQGAISIVEREADAFNEEEVQIHLRKQVTTACIQTFTTSMQNFQWPIKIDLVSPKAPFFENANIMLTADCAPVVLKNFHFLAVGKQVIIGCPKFNDARAYAAKLLDILKVNNIARIMVIHMEVPCCTGLKWTVNKALAESGKNVPILDLEVKIEGETIEHK
ncbi:MAG: 4Fe-4S ferredoxin [Candidatus Bathyarchaeota archaeon]|nr:4Fe-4S ferredoxin [Candidatus Termiticorpusculum sp.]MCL1970475.1 4Fe-4S ferredoxin [Candidatus Termiticorpusculum sp.]